MNKGLDLPSFNLYFGILLIILSILLLVGKYLKPVDWFVKRGKQRSFTDKKGETYVFGYPVWFALLLTFIVGFVSGLFGIGGGSVMVPAMILSVLVSTAYRCWNINVHGLVISTLLTQLPIFRWETYLGFIQYRSCQPRILARK